MYNLIYVKSKTTLNLINMDDFRIKFYGSTYQTTFLTVIQKIQVESTVFFFFCFLLWTHKNFVFKKQHWVILNGVLLCTYQLIYVMTLT